MFEDLGLRVTHVVPFSHAAHPGSPICAWVTDFQKLYLPTLVEKGYLTSAELETYWAWWLEREADPRTIFYAPPVFGVIGRVER